MGFSRQEYWSGLSFPSPGDLPDLGIKSQSPTPQADCLPAEPPGSISSSNTVYSACSLWLLKLNVLWWKIADLGQEIFLNITSSLSWSLRQISSFLFRPSLSPSMSVLAMIRILDLSMNSSFLEIAENLVSLCTSFWGLPQQIIRTEWLKWTELYSLKGTEASYTITNPAPIIQMRKQVQYKEATVNDYYSFKNRFELWFAWVLRLLLWALSHDTSWQSKFVLILI